MTLQSRRTTCWSSDGRVVSSRTRTIRAPAYHGRHAVSDSGAGVPSSLLLIHGAGSGPWVFEQWMTAFPEIEVAALDLQEGLDVERASMRHYA